MEPIKCEFCQKLVTLQHYRTDESHGQYVHATIEHYHGACKCGHTYRLEVCGRWIDDYPEALPDLEGSRRV